MCARRKIVTKVSTRFPKEFNNSTYAVCATWTVHNWARALYARLPYADYFLGEVSFPKDNRDRYIEVALGFMQNPMYASPTLPYVQPLRDQYAMEFFKGKSRADEDLGYRDWCEKLEAVENDQLHDWNPLGIEDSSPLENLLYCRFFPAWEMHQKLAPRSSVGKIDFCLQVDLSAPDKVLIDEFSKWLITARQRSPLQQDFKDNFDLQVWAKRRYLALLDLKFWSMASGMELTDEQIAEFVFSEELNEDKPGFSLDNIRKTFLPNAMRLLTRSFVQGLQYYAGPTPDASE